MKGIVPAPGGGGWRSFELIELESLANRRLSPWQTVGSVLGKPSAQSKVMALLRERRGDLSVAAGRGLSRSGALSAIVKALRDRIIR